MNKYSTVNFENLEKLKAYVDTICPQTDTERDFRRVRLSNSTVFRMMESGADLQSIIVELDRQYNKLLADLLKLSLSQPSNLCFKDFEDFED